MLSVRVAISLLVVACIAGATSMQLTATTNQLDSVDFQLAPKAAAAGDRNDPCWPCITFIDIWKTDDSAKFKNNIEALCDVFVGPQPFDQCLDYLEKNAGSVQTGNSSAQICHYFGLCIKS